MPRAHRGRRSHRRETTRLAIVRRVSGVSGWKRRWLSRKGQWNELLQSSLDSNLRRMVEQLAQRSQEVLQTAEQRMTERLGELRQPFAQAASDARDTFTGIQSSLDQEVAKARESLAAVELVASRTKELSAQLEAASHDTVNELHRRLEKILDAQTAEMDRRAESISAGIPQRVAPALDWLTHQFLERLSASAEAKLAPHIDRVPALLHELSAREVEVEESLRLASRTLAPGFRKKSTRSHRADGRNLERRARGLRGGTHGSPREVGRGTRRQWSSRGACGRRIHWSYFGMAAAGSAGAPAGPSRTVARDGQRRAGRENRRSRAKIRSPTRRAIRSASGADPLASGKRRGRSDWERPDGTRSRGRSCRRFLWTGAARTYPSAKATQFAADSSATRRERTEEFDRSTQELLHQLDVNAWSSVERFRSQMASQLESSVNEGRAALSAEFTSSLEGYRAERDTHQQEWLVNLDRLSGKLPEDFRKNSRARPIRGWLLPCAASTNTGRTASSRCCAPPIRPSAIPAPKSSKAWRKCFANALPTPPAPATSQAFRAIPNRDTSENSGPRNEAI